MALEDLLLLGNPGLHKKASPIKEKDLESLDQMVSKLHDTLMAFREIYGAGRAIAAPQVGIFKRLIYMHTDRPYILINPVLLEKSPQMMVLWDDCLSFPELLVRVRRHRRCKIRFQDSDLRFHEWALEGDLSELLQHEVDHLDGILATQRAIDTRSFRYRVEPFKRIK
jgi:peptide deformylase